MWAAFVIYTADSRIFWARWRHKCCGYHVGPDAPRTSLSVSTLPLRVRFGLFVAAIVAGVIGALGWLSLRMFERQVGATFWFALSGILIVTLLSGLRPIRVTNPSFTSPTLSDTKP